MIIWITLLFYVNVDKIQKSTIAPFQLFLSMTFNLIKQSALFFSFSKTFFIFYSFPYMLNFPFLMNISKTSEKVRKDEKKRWNMTKKIYKKIRNKTAETQSFIFWIIMYKNEVDSKTPKISRIISKKSGKELSVSTDS